MSAARRSVALGLAAGIAALGSIGYIWAGLLWMNAIPVVVGFVGLIVAAGCGGAPDAARVVAMVAGPLALLPGLFGAWGLTTIIEDWFYCAGRQSATAAIGDASAIFGLVPLHRSLPPDFCQRVDWVTQWGIGLGLAGAGVAGILVFVVLIAAGSDSRAPSATPD